MRRLLTSTLLLSINADIRTREKRIMRTKMIAALLMLIPAAVLADAMATCITIFDAETFREMTATNTIDRVADGDLFTKSLLRGCYFGGKNGDDVATDFKWGGKEYRLLVRRAETKTIYAVLLARTDQPPQVLAVGDIDRVPLSKEVKDNSKGDPFVVVVRSGNYLRH